MDPETVVPVDEVEIELLARIDMAHLLMRKAGAYEVSTVSRREGLFGERKELISGSDERRRPGVDVQETAAESCKLL